MIIFETVKGAIQVSTDVFDNIYTTYLGMYTQIILAPLSGLHAYM